MVRIWMMFEDNTFFATPPIERYLAELLLHDLAFDHRWEITTNPSTYKTVIRAKII